MSPYKKGLDSENPVAPKVAAASLAGALTVVIVYVAGVAGLEIPPEVASAFTAVLAAGAGWLKKSNDG